LVGLMQRPCEGKVALIIGGTRGIGRSAVLALAEAGADVIVVGRSLDTAQAVATEALQFGGTSLAIAVDVADTDAMQAATDRVVEQFGRLDILVANAGISPYWMRAEQITPAIWDELMAINLRGAFFSIQAAGRHMLAQGSGSIVAISSVTSAVGVSKGLPYVATKGGMDAMTRSLAVEWAGRGVRVNGVAPGYVATEMTHGMRENPGLADTLLSTVPMDRFAEPEEIASVIAFLGSDAASYITGQILIVDGGFAAGRNSDQRRAP
jgi:3-oxoacyl-[acyl-carrier protein] reductase